MNPTWESDKNDDMNNENALGDRFSPPQIGRFLKRQLRKRHWGP